MSFKLRRVTMRNWQTVREATLEFPDKGLVLVIGQNQAAHGRMKSVGSGKSALGDAISRVVLGVKGRFSNFGAHSNDKTGNKDMFVSVELEDGSRRLTVDGGYRCKELSKTGEGLRYTLNGVPLERGMIKDTRAELSALVGVSELLAEHTIHVDGDKLKFNKLPQSAIVDLVIGVLGQSNWDSHLKRVRQLALPYKEADVKFSASIAEMERSLSDLAEEIETAKTSIETEKTALADRQKRQKDDVAELNAELAEVKKNATANEAEKRAVKAKIKKMEDEAAKDLHELEIRMRDLQEIERETNAVYLTALRGTTSCTKDKSRTRSELSEVESSAVCPTCRRPYEDKIEEVKKAKERLQKRLSDLEAQFKECQVTERNARLKHEDAQVKYDAANERLKELAKRNDVSDLSDQYSDLEDAARKIDEEINEIKQAISRKSAPLDQTRLTRFSAILEEREKHEKGLKARIQNEKDEASHNRAIIRVLEYWETAFSPTGIPNVVLNDGLTIINQACERLSRILTGGTLDLRFSATREMKSGTERPELSIDVANAIGSSKVEGSSKGEAGLTNLILAESLMEVSRVWERVGYRWLDEVVNSQDQVVRQTIYSYLREQAQSRGVLVFVVDHHADVREHADYTLVATKDANGTTTYAWA
jgi:DNA repair exonuclease SbcCD ATPase subunit